MTLNVPTGNTGSVSLASMRLNYQIHGEKLQTPINSKALAVAIVAPEQRIQAQQSIDKEVYKKSWVENNLGRMKKNLSKWMREGKKDKAKQEIHAYRQEMKDAATASNMPLVSTEIESQLKEMDEKIDDTFAGSVSEQNEKRNRVAKSMQYESIKSQRKNY
jgi:fructose-specific phosphotransferase system component IIB